MEPEMINSPEVNRPGAQRSVEASQRWLGLPNGSPQAGSFPYPLPPGLVRPPEDDLDLRRLLGIAKRRALILAAVTGVAAVGFTTSALSRPDEYVGGFRLLVEPVTANSQLAEDPLRQSLQQDGLDYVSQIQVLRSQTLLEPVVQSIQARYPEISYQTLTSRLSIVRPEESKILEFSYRSTDPAEIQFVLAQLADAYIRYSIEDPQTNLSRALSFVDQQIQQQQSQVTSLEGSLEGFRRRNNLNDPTAQAQSLSEQRTGLLQQLRDNQVELASSVTLYNNLQQQLGLSPAEAVVASTLSEAPVYQDLLTQLRDIESQIALESARFRENSPVIQALQDQREQLLPLIEAEAGRILGRSSAVSGINLQTLGFQGSVGRELVQQLVTVANQIQTLQSRDRAVSQAIVQLNGQIQEFSGVSRQYGEIQRDLQIALSSLDRLLAARETLQLEVARQETPWQLISKIDQSNIAAQSNTSRQVLLSIIGSLLLGMGAALLVEKLDQAFHSLEDLKETKLPCLGAVPFHRSLKQGTLKLLDTETQASLAQSKSNSRQYAASFLEAFYSIDANIRLLSSDTPVRSLTVTSASPGDGKSTTSAHLALAAANMGRRVLLVDTDMRRPQVHRLFGIDNIRGLSNILATNLKPDKVIQVSPQDPNLHLLTAGQIPPAPGRLLSSRKMQTLAELFAQKFDLVIYDSPPLVGFADAKLMATHCDGILLVVGLGKTNRSLLKRALEDLNATAQAPVLGTIANGLKQSSSDHYGYYYRRYYQQNDKD